MFYCTICATEHGFPKPEELFRGTCPLCSRSGVEFGEVITAAVPLHNRLVVANHVQAMVDSLYKYADRKPTPVEFLREVEEVMKQRLHPNVGGATNDSDNDAE